MSKRIGLLTDSLHFPNLPLMKISAFYKKCGDFVEIVKNNLERYDILYISKIFNLNLPTIKPLFYYPYADEIRTGGSGFALTIQDGKEIYNNQVDLPLPAEIENIYPDYSLYPEYTKNTAYGYLTRGCPNNCSFCIVSKKDGLCSKQVADLKQFWNGQKFIRLLDANILACKDRNNLFEQLIKSGASVDYTQGIDARLITDETAKLLCKTKIDIAHFAWDFMKNEIPILNGLKIFSKFFGKTYRNKRVYILTNYDTTPQEDYYRVKKVVELGYCAYVMIYQKGTHTKFLTDLARWANNIAIFSSTKFEDYIPRKDGIKVGKLYKDILKGV